MLPPLFQVIYETRPMETGESWASGDHGGAQLVTLTQAELMTKEQEAAVAVANLTQGIGIPITQVQTIPAPGHEGSPYPTVFSQVLHPQLAADPYHLAMANIPYSCSQ